MDRRAAADACASGLGGTPCHTSIMLRAIVAAAVLASCTPAPAAAEPRASASRSDGVLPSEARFLSPVERGVAEALARLRRDPRGYARELRAHRARFDGDLVAAPGEDVAIRTQEGVAAVDEAIRAVSRSARLPPIRVSPALSRVARRHAEAIGRDGTLDHASPDGTPPHGRMQRAGRLVGLSGENIGTGYRDGAQMLLSLVVDDGVPDRGHRKNLLEPEFRVVGVGCAPHRAYRVVCVMDFAAGFAPR